MDRAEDFWQPVCRVCGKKIQINTWEAELCEDHKPSFTIFEWDCVNRTKEIIYVTTDGFEARQVGEAWALGFCEDEYPRYFEENPSLYGFETLTDFYVMVREK